MTVERAFGCHLKENETHITFVSRIVSACCVLHNFCEIQIIYHATYDMIYIT